jgi:hypothetical protein
VHSTTSTPLNLNGNISPALSYNGNQSPPLHYPMNSSPVHQNFGWPLANLLTPPATQFDHRSMLYYTPQQQQLYDKNFLNDVKPKLPLSSITGQYTML